MINQKELAEDLTQTVFIKLNHHKENINEENKIPAWLYKTARNEVYQHLRKNYSAKVVALDYELQSSNDIANDFENDELIELMNRELNKVADEQREVFILREYSGMSYKEIADLLEINVDVVKSRLYMARQQLLKKLSKFI